MADIWKPTKSDTDRLFDKEAKETSSYLGRQAMKFRALGHMPDVSEGTKQRALKLADLCGQATQVAEGGD